MKRTTGPFDIDERNPRRRMTKKQAAEMTILQLADFVVDQSENNGLTDKSISELHTPLAELAKRFGITEIEALLLSVFINNFDDHRIRMNDLGRHFNCKPVRLLSYWESIRHLAKLNYIRMSSKNEDFFSVPTAMMQAVRENKVYQIPSYTNLTEEKFYDRVNELLGYASNGTMDTDTLHEEIRALIMGNQQLDCCQVIVHLHVNDEQMAMLLVTAVHFLYDGDEHIIASDVEEVFCTTSNLRANLRLIAAGRHPLQKEKMIEQTCDDGIASQNAWKLSREAKSKLFSKMEIELQPQEDTRGLTLPENISEKRLYFRPETQKQVDKLRHLISKDRFKQVQDRLEQNGMRRGVACIFYGGPGTGKTETVMQLAKETGRGIMLVDISQMRDKFVGETEKRIKQTFDRYRQLVREQAVAPILVFNEADALFCSRNEHAKDSVDKMENAMQNIILQEMETLEGILIATTNLAGSMDTAFERRFLYKVEFKNPSPEEARHIWRAMLKDINDEDALTLAREFGFSGGQIENIARKQLISSLIDDEEMTLDQLRTLCQEELLKTKTTQRVGFSAA